MKLRAYLSTIGWPVLAFVAAGLLMAGCSDDDDTTAPPAPTLPTSGDAVVEIFETIYNDRDIDGYRALLHPDFKFLLDTTAPRTEDYLNYDTDTAITATMFSGEQGDAAEAYPITAILLAANPVGTWLPVPDDDPDFGGLGAEWREYNVALEIQREGYPALVISGPVDYYVVQVETREGEPSRASWQLLGQWDHTANSGRTEDTSWSEVKLLYQSTQ